MREKLATTRQAFRRPRAKRLSAGAAGAWMMLALTAGAHGQTLGVVPILIGPIQVLLAILPAMLVALGGALVAMLKPSAIKAGVKMLWRNKLLTALLVVGIGGGVYLFQHAFAGSRQAARGATGGADWPAMRGGPERRGWSAQGQDPAAGGAVWSFRKEVKTFYASCALVGNRLYAASADKGPFTDRGAIYCLDADNGAVVWKYSPGNFRATYSSPSVVGKYLVCGEGLHVTRDARITCLDAASGNLLWEHRTASHVESSPCIADGKVYIGAGDDGLYGIALKARDGKPDVLWHLDGNLYPDCETSPIWQDGKVYFGMGEDGSAVACVRGDTGEELWKVPTPYPVFSSPVLAEGRLFVGMGNGNLVEPAEVVREKKLRQMRQQGLDEQRIAEAARTLGPAGEVWCLDPRTGSVLWKRQFPQTILGVIAAAEGRIYFGSQDGVFHCLTADGQVAYERDVHEPIVTSAAVGREHVYFLTDSGRLYALDRLRNRVVWQATAGTAGAFLSSPVVGRGHAYVGTGQDGLVCLGVPAQGRTAPVWGGYLGGSGQSGWTDGSPLPAQGSFAWRWPEDDAEGAPTAAVTSPAAYMDSALYVTVGGPGRSGLARLLIGKAAESAAGSQQARRAQGRYVENWFFPCPLGVRVSPAAGDGRVYIFDGRPGQQGRSLYCIEAATGKELWKVPVDPQAAGQYLLTGDGLLALVRAGTLTRLAVEGAQAGQVQDEWPMEGAAVGPPAVGSDLALVALAEPAAVAAVDLRGRATGWRAPLSAAPVTGPLTNGDIVVVGTESGLEALSIVNGARLWGVECGAASAPLVCDETRIACATRGGQVVLLDWTGREILRLEGTEPGIPPMLCGDSMLVCQADGSIQRVDLAADKDTAGPAGRSERWLPTDWMGKVTAAGILVDSVLYFATDGKALVSARARK